MTVGSADLMMVPLSPEVGSFLLIIWRDAPLSTINSGFSCSQSDQDATPFSSVVLLAGRKNFHTPAPMLSSEHIPCLFRQDLHNLRVARTIEHPDFDHFVHRVEQFSRLDLSSALSQDALRRETVGTFCKIDFPGIADTPLRRYPIALNCCEVIFSSARV